MVRRWRDGNQDLLVDKGVGDGEGKGLVDVFVACPGRPANYSLILRWNVPSREPVKPGLRS